MHVLATAGHVDHGKSTLVRALTGTDPDRLAEEKRRGLTIELGYAFTDLPSGARLGLVDVPGHERFLATMLSGVGPAPAVLLVVAADEGWSAQTADHVAVLDALAVRHVLVAVTKADRADPASVLADPRLRDWPRVAVSGRTGAGLDDLRRGLDALCAGLPEPPAAQGIRLYADRVFAVPGAGTVVTGTLREGTLRVGDVLDHDGREVRVRGLESAHEPVDDVAAVARVAVNLRGDRPRRGDVLTTPGAFRPTSVVDVALTADVRGDHVLHVGAAAVRCRVRVLAMPYTRLELDRPLPLVAGDRAVLRDPGRAGSTVAAGVTVLDAAPPPLVARGAARARAAELASPVPPPAPAAAQHPEIAWGTGAFATVDLDVRERAVLAGAGLILRIGRVALRPGADAVAAERLARLPQPFSVQDAKAALDVPRSTLIPLLEHLDRRRMTRRDGDLRWVR